MTSTGTCSLSRVETPQQGRRGCDGNKRDHARRTSRLVASKPARTCALQVQFVAVSDGWDGFSSQRSRCDAQEVVSDALVRCSSHVRRSFPFARRCGVLSSFVAFITTMGIGSTSFFVVVRFPCARALAFHRFLRERTKRRTKDG